MSFPTLSKEQDERYFSVSHEDPSLKSDIEGGYVVTRSRFTRTPRRTFSTGFTDISEADKTALEAYWDSKKGGSGIVSWTHPVTDVVIQTRFVSELDFKYTGIGGFHRWTVQFKLQEV